MTIPGTFGRDVGEGDAAPTDPLALLASWLPSPSAPVKPLMTLSTLGLDGYPNARNVLLSAFDGARLHFHTEARSRKATELAAAPRASATLVWPEAARQVVVTGDVTPETATESATAYATRTRGLQLLAWLNTDELAAQPLARRRAVWADYQAEHPEMPLAPPTTWVGYTIAPVRIVFWRGDDHGPSNRLMYTAGGAGWSLERRAG